MRHRLLLIILALLGSGLPTQGTGQPTVASNELRVWTTRAVATVLAQVGADFERAAGLRLNVLTGLPTDFERRFAAGERFDVLVRGSATVNDWARAGRVLGATRATLARSGIGIAVASGRPRPDVATVRTFRRTLLDAKSVAYLRVGSGLYLDSLFQRLDLQQNVAAKAIRPEGDSVAILVAQGRAELGLVVITQILTTPGVDLVGPLPPELQSYITFVAAVSPTSRLPAAAHRLIRFLEGPVAAPVFRAQGMERPPF